MEQFVNAKLKGLKIGKILISDNKSQKLCSFWVAKLRTLVRYGVDVLVQLILTHGYFDPIDHSVRNGDDFRSVFGLVLPVHYLLLARDQLFFTCL